MRKWIAMAVILVAAAGWTFVGCAKKNTVDTAKVEQSFQSADPATKSDVDKACDAAKAGNYQQALVSLQKVASNAKLTPEQQQAVKDLINQIQKDLSANATKAVQDAQKSLPKY